MARTNVIEILINSKDNATPNIKVLGLSLTDLKSGIDMVATGARKMAQVVEAAFDFTEAGAAVLQTRDSFERLGLSIEDMRAKSLGTVDDMTLMSSALMLAAGASENLQGYMLEAAPQLLEIAKAANAVNPAVGDTAFLFESLARGIKRSSPFIIDNTGLILKLGAANEAYAAQLGKAVEELSAEEKQIALLNATLEAGVRLIEQAGGSTESATDAWARLRVELKNTTDAAKANAAEGVQPLISRYADLLSELRASDTALIGITASYRMFRDVLFGVGGTIEGIDYDKAYGGLARWTDLEKEASEKESALALNAHAVASGLAAASQGFSDVGASAPIAAEGIRDAGNAADEAQIAFFGAAAGLSEMSVAAFVTSQLQALQAMMDEGTLSTAEFVAAQEALLRTFGLLTDAEVSAQGTLETLRGLYEAGGLSAQAYAAAVRAVKSSIDELESKEISIDVKFNVGELRLPSPRAMDIAGPGVYVPPKIMQASGGDYIVNRPTPFIAGDAGPERAIFIPQGQPGFSGPSGGGGAGGGIGTLNLNVYGTADAHETALLVMAEFQGRGLMPQRPMR